MALEYFCGAWAGGHSREGYRENTWTRIGPVCSLHHLYFGGEFDPAQDVHNYAMPVAVADYCPPALFLKMAQDRSGPHVVKKTKAPRNIIRHTDWEASPVRKYTYMSQSFALGSTQVGLPGPPTGPIDLVSWDLKGTGIGGDVGVLASVRPDLKVGVSIHDISKTGVTYTDGGSTTLLPRSIRLGVAWEPRQDVLLALDIDRKLHIGSEIRLNEWLSRRGGIQKDLKMFEMLPSDNS